MDVPQNEYDRLEKLIECAESPVGIDAKKTHIIILHKLDEIARRLAKIEAKLNQ